MKNHLQQTKLQGEKMSELFKKIPVTIAKPNYNDYKN